jgi:asparagine synthase (glutamine-hydrolysing)
LDSAELEWDPEGSDPKMSAIGGIFHRDGARVRTFSLEKILAAMPDRACDGGATWSEASLGFGHGVLDATPEPVAEKLPFVDRRTGFACVGDLRIDHRDDLGRQLGVHRSGESAVGDAELVLAAYDRWGIEAPARLRGAFAFAIWDPRRHEVFCARDHLGCKPFAYHLSRELFVFASEAEAVAAAPDVPRRLNEARIADFLIDELEGIDHTSSFFLDVQRLPPAHSLVVGRDAQRLSCYWRPDPTRELLLSSDHAYVERFRATLESAVAACSRSQLPVGVMVSGGVDSGVVAAAADSLSGQPDGGSFVNLSAVADEACLETRCIRETTASLSSKSSFLELPSVRKNEKSIECAISKFSEPFDSHLVMPSLLYQVARNQGVRVVLDGVDGDVVMSAGGMHIAHLLRRGRLLRASREARALCRVQHGEASWLRSVVGASILAFVPDAARRARRRFRLSSGRVDDAMVSGIINRDFARRVDLGSRLDRLDRLKWFRASGDLRRDHADCLVHPYIAAALERYERVAVRFGIDLRHPLLNLEVVELCLSMPWHLKTRDGWTKYIARTSFAGELPKSVCWRRDFENVMWRFTSRVLDVEAPFVASTIRNGVADIEPYVDIPTVLEELGSWEVHRDPNAAKTVLQAYTLATWLRRVA